MLQQRTADPIMKDPTAGKTIGVVIPAFGHPQFLAEAIISACTQECAGRLLVVVVDDGCRFPETGQTVSHLMQRFRGKLHYLRQENTRLPGARNTGVRFLLALEPDLDSIFFLDADNRIAPYALQQYRQTLGDDPKVGWAYPDIAFFGLSWGEDGFDIRETAPDYSRLKHLRGNVSEAGSLVRTDMFRQGIYFDETMRNGFEDWDFWLSALGAGFVGRRAQHAGFLYRRRPESMLADSRRQEEELISRMHRKHASLFAPRNLMALEQVEAPAFAIVSADTGAAHLTSDPLIDGVSLDAAAFSRLVRKWYAGPKEFFFPEHIVIATDEQWAQLKAQPAYLRWLFWAMKEAAQPFQRWLFETREFPYSEGVSPETPTVGNTILNVSAKGLMKLLTAAGKLEEVEISPHVFQTPLPLVAGHKRSVYTVLKKRLNSLVKDAGGQKPSIRHANRRYAGPDAFQVRRGLIDEVCAEENRHPYPACGTRKRVLLAVGQEVLLKDAARAAFVEFLEHVGKCHEEVLLVVERGRKHALQELGVKDWLPLVADFVMLDTVQSSEEYRMYLGRRIYSLFTLKAKEDGAILARTVDKIIVYGAAAFLEVLGDARQHGVKGYVYLDSSLTSDDPDLGEDGAKILAFEHAEEKIVCDSPVTPSALTAQGFPPGKFIDSRTFFDLLEAD